MNFALGFATIDRIFAAERLIRSARLFFPELPLYVAEQCKADGAFAQFCTRHGVTRIKLPYDSGVSASRNALVSAIREELFVLCDDDFILTPETSFTGALEILKANPDIGIVGGYLSDLTEDGRQSRHWEMFLNLDRARKMLALTPIDQFAPLSENTGPYRYYNCDTVLNFSVMRRAIFDPVIRWDPVFKCNGEHEDFYLNLKINSDIRVVYFPEMRADHQHISSRQYAQKRSRREGWQDFLKKWDLEQYLDQTHGLHTRAGKVSGVGFEKKRSWDSKAATHVVTAVGEISTLASATNEQKHFLGASIDKKGRFNALEQRQLACSQSAASLYLFAAFDPILTSATPTTIWLQSEDCAQEGRKCSSASLSLLLRWRIDDHYLNWSGVLVDYTHSDRTASAWKPFQIKLPFAMQNNACVDLEIWEKTSNRLLTICNFKIAHRNIPKFYPKSGLCIAHTPLNANDAKHENRPQLELKPRMQKTAVLRHSNTIDITDKSGATWRLAEGLETSYLLPKRFPYNAASLILP